MYKSQVMSITNTQIEIYCNFHGYDWDMFLFSPFNLSDFLLNYSDSASINVVIGWHNDCKHKSKSIIYK